MFKALEEMSYYELLEVDREAPAEEIQLAYERHLALLDGDSLAGYTLVDGEQAQMWRELLERAHHTLIDAVERRDYDQLGAPPAGRLEEMKLGAQPLISAAPSALFEVDSSTSEASELVESSEIVEPAAPVLAEPVPITAETVFDGSLLQRVRESLGITITEIADVTKISKHYLRCIESGSWREMPADVYLKGFVRQYAQYLGLDVSRVVESYMAVKAGKERGS